MFDTLYLRPLQEKLKHHPIYAAVQDLDDLHCFMQHHVYPVWDFMSLVKYLQHHLAPSSVPWLPECGDAASVRFINELVLGEESDESLPAPDGQPVYASHFMMSEIII